MIFWVAWLAIGLGAVICITVIFLPRLMLKVRAAAIPVTDKPVARGTDENGDVVWFETAPSVRPYIKSYRIAKDAKGLYFCGEWNRLVAFVKYEIVVYNAANNIVNILHVKEKFNDGAETHITRLPKNTDYISLRMICADDTPLRAERNPFNLRFGLWLAVLCLVAALLTDLLLWVGVTVYLRLVDAFTATMGFSVATWAELLGLGALASAALIGAVELVRFFSMRKGGET